MKTTQQTVEELADAFCRWPLPETVCADPCATEQMRGRTGTNLLSVVEARQMFEAVVGTTLATLTAEAERERLDKEKAHRIHELDAELGHVHGKIGLFAEKWWGISNNLPTDETFRQMEERLTAAQAALKAAEKEAASWHNAVKSFDAMLCAMSKDGWITLQGSHASTAHAMGEELVSLRAALKANAEDKEKYKSALEGLNSMFRRVVNGDGCMVFLDGRNEHGTHILPGDIGHFDWSELSAIEVRDGDPAFVENVFKEAEEAGFKEGDWVWLNWRRDPGQRGEEGRWEIEPYIEYAGVDVEMSKALNPLRAAIDAARAPAGEKEGV